ncbi:hypothetical protein HDA32_002811 [Spinactinospora alkalitolerans]|uniref:Mycothiol-dependent maleylpyruvate isomerase metal-binding domain-containing protein n=1 Tax=Spinactinospora alkalitolerans TaxID=687207 RepID=A0A852TVG5_9ACTN|nr:maleylpyruvate isomerase N-terminal domain-containing protein [Spinactinospora alkalitolerans]NYE47691.1 hypothetical protein [Spinactinospora alkalitolerans]
MDTARVYARSQARLLDLAARMSSSQERTPVPALPGWTVRDTYAHLAGVCADTVAGTADPDIGAEWTAGHIEQRRHLDLAAVCERWGADGPAVAGMLRAAPGFPLVRAALDVWHHEHDIRGALGLPGGREDAAEVADVLARGRARGWEPDAPAVVLVATDAGARWSLGEGERALVLRATAFELARMLIGRRSRAQVLAMDWSGPAGAVADRMNSFPMPTADLVE